MDKISIIIPVKNEGAKIGQCLEAVFSQYLKSQGVIVVDGHSTDGTFEDTHIKQRRNDNNTKEVSKIE